jgi:hypothetical protein
MRALKRKTNTSTQTTEKSKKWRKSPTAGRVKRWSRQTIGGMQSCKSPLGGCLELCSSLALERLSGM